MKNWSTKIAGGALLVLITLIGLALAQPAVRAQESGGAAFSIGAMTAVSNYPRGMTFTLEASSSAGDITRATLFWELRPGTRQRFNADLDLERGAWVVEPYAVRGGLPPWIDFDYTWLLTDSAGNTFETEPVYAVYADHTRQWQSIDTEDITLYWFGGMPNLGDTVGPAMANMRELFRLGWGRNISYKPLAVLFPPGSVWDEYVELGNNPNAGGFTSNGWGYTVQRMAWERTPADLALLPSVCGGMYSNGSAATSEEYRTRWAVEVIVHEITHLHQSDFRVGGPHWWIEGQAEYFASLSGYGVTNAEGRLRNYVGLGYDFPTLQGNGPSPNTTNPSADGCVALGYNIGETFLRYLVDSQGGLEAHAQVIAALSGNSLEDALALVTGRTLLDLENEYRASYGLGPVQLLPTATPFVMPTAAPVLLPTASGDS